MADIASLIDVVRNYLLQSPDIVSEGFGPNNMTRRFLSQLKGTPQMPLMTIYYDPDKREKWAPVDNLILYIEVHTNDFTKTESVAKTVAALLHNWMTSQPSCIVYQSLDMGGPVIPINNPTLNCWTSTLMFDMRVG